MLRPLIGLPGRRTLAGSIHGFPPNLGHIGVDLYLADYSRGLVEAGGLPVNLPIDADPVELADHLDGVLLTGGADISPDRYGHEPETDLFPPEDRRDSFELALLGRAVARELPVLGICRGLQLINVHAGGTLNQDVPPHSCFAVAPDTEVHPVEFAAGSILHRLYGATRQVNSLHHQTVQELAPGLNITGRSDDGTVEGLESDDGCLVAVQWHPEMMRTRPDDPIFAWLVEAATKRMA
ncbi:MAG: gamma-glutamyl-gamma-aminobutyrate hydrolase family protein [Actinomycetia bacterium]|nr:gamma-glutamyl-gamma-aminobutyrate hydrolase family protein [Actinomycetes bacterium]